MQTGRTSSGPRDLDGKIYGGFGSAWENALIGTIIRHDGGTGDFETVTLGTSAYEALANGAVDFTLEVYTWEGVKAERDGPAQRAFRYADFGVPDRHTIFIGTTSAYLADHAERPRPSSPPLSAATNMPSPIQTRLLIFWSPPMPMRHSTAISSGHRWRP